MKSGLPEVHFKGFILQSQSAVPNISMTKFKKTIRFPVSYPPVADLSPLIFAIHSTSLRPKFSPLAGENSGFPEGGGGDPAAINRSSKYFNDQIQKKQSVLISPTPRAGRSLLIFAIHSTSLRPRFSPLAGENSGFPEGGGGDPAATNCSSKYFNDQIQKKQSVLISPIPGADRSLLIFASSQPCSSSVIPVRKGYSNLLLISIIYTIKLFYPHK